MLPLFISHILKLSTAFFLSLSCSLSLCPSLTEIPYFEFFHLFWYHIRVGCADVVQYVFLFFRARAFPFSVHTNLHEKRNEWEKEFVCVCVCLCECEANSVYGSFGMFSTHAQTWSHAVWSTCRTSETILSSSEQLKIGHKEIRFSLVRRAFGTTLENSLQSSKNRKIIT